MSEGGKSGKDMWWDLVSNNYKICPNCKPPEMGEKGETVLLCRECNKIFFPLFHLIACTEDTELKEKP